MNSVKTKYYVYILLALFSQSILNAQSDKKFEKLVETGNFDKLITLSEKRVENQTNDAVGYYFLTKGYVIKHQNSEGKKKEYHYYLATKKYDKYREFKQPDMKYKDLDSLMHVTGKMVYNNIPESSKQRRMYYAKFLAENFNDTITGYNKLIETTFYSPEKRTERLSVAFDYKYTQAINREIADRRKFFV